MNYSNLINEIFTEPLNSKNFRLIKDTTQISKLIDYFEFEMNKEEKNLLLQFLIDNFNTNNSFLNAYMKPLSPKIIKPKNKYFISHVDEDSLKRFINNHLSKKYSSQKKKDLFSSRSEKYNRTIYNFSRKKFNIFTKI